GMALGKLVITTSIGLEGIPAKHKKEVLIADTPQEFTEALMYCESHMDDVLRMGENAKNFVQQQFDNKEIAKTLYNKYNYYLFKISYC
ncbi:MAG: glycosyltransferase, partial [Bacteroidota bacterium]